MKDENVRIHLDAKRLLGFDQLPENCTPRMAGDALNKVGEVPPAEAFRNESALEQVGKRSS